MPDFKIEGFEFCQDCGTYVKIENFDFDLKICNFCEADEALEAEAREAQEEDD